MKIAPFAIEQYFARYEFSTPHNLCASDCETMPVAELLTMAGLSLADLGRLQLSYTESQGHPELRQAIAATYDTVRPEEVVVLTSPEEGIYLIMRTLLGPGDQVVVLAPAYESLLTMAEHVTGRVDRWMVEATEDGWRIDLEQLESLVSDQTTLIVVNFPHNPTGFLPSRAELAAVADIARRHQAWLFCDEMYRGLEPDSEQTLPSAVELYPQALVLAGLSKVHGLPGLRSGWLVVRDDRLRDDLINWKHYTSICPPAPSEFLAMAALQVEDQLIARSRAIIAGNLAAAGPFFDRWETLFRWRPPQAGSVALLGLAQPSATAYCHRLAQEAGVLLLPSSCLGYGDQHVRMGFGRAGFASGLAHYERHLASQA